MTTFTVSFTDLTGQFSAQAAAIQANVLYAASMVAKWLPGLGDIAIKIFIDPAVPTANGASATAKLIGTQNGIGVYAQGMASEMATGIDPNGGVEDVRIRVGANFLNTVSWVDPTPETSDDIPATGYDFITTMVHELLHSVCFNGFRNMTTGELLNGNVMSTFDTNFQMIGGQPFFIGPTAVAIFGGAVPLTAGNFYHYGSSAAAAKDLLDGVESGFGRELGRRYDLNDLDLAILQDSGVRISRPTTGTEASETLSSPLAGVFSGLGGNDVISGSLYGDTIDGGSGTDTVAYAGSRTTYSVAHSGGGYSVSSSVEGGDLLLDVERIRFGDYNLALDLDGVAGTAAKLVGAVFGRDFLEDREIMGIAISLLDAGMSYQQLSKLAVGTGIFASLAGSHSHADFVAYVYENVMGVAIGAAELALYTGLLDSGDMTQGAFALIAAESPMNQLQIDLVGLTQSGLEYLMA
jgi:hypothetical protein